MENQGAKVRVTGASGWNESAQAIPTGNKNATERLFLGNQSPNNNKKTSLAGFVQ